jgi:hypothetical protein
VAIIQFKVAVYCADHPEISLKNETFNDKGRIRIEVQPCRSCYSKHYQLGRSQANKKQGKEIT